MEVTYEKFEWRKKRGGASPLSRRRAVFGHAIEKFCWKSKSLRKGFTLAEVLITLGIIGIVAAMTIPTLIAKYQERQTVSKLTKAYATVSNAYAMAKANYGDLSMWGFTTNSSTIKDEEGNTIFSEDTYDNIKLFWTIMSEYMRVSKWYIDVTISDSNKMYYLGGQQMGSGKKISSEILLPDGVSLLGGWIDNYKCPQNTKCGDFSIDINGNDNPPNTVGKDVFYFYIYDKGIIPMGNVDASDFSFETYCDPDVDIANNGYGCTAWVIYNKNMDYLHCRDELSWDGKHKCSD